MSNISLLGSIQTCKVDAGWANKIQSARFENPDLMVCPPWSGYNIKGQQVCPNSFNSTTAGCSSPMLRVDVENDLRPKYMEYVTLNADGLNGDLYGNNMARTNSNHRTQANGQTDSNTPHFGVQFGSQVHNRCNNQYSQAAMQSGYGNH
jgi:hypothetical protein